KTYTNYRYNHYLDNGDIISYKTSLDKIPAFVRIDEDGIEKIVHRPGIIFDESINYRKEWVVWSEQISDLRWSHSGLSEIQFLNVETGKKLSLKPDFKAFAPSISLDLNRLIVVETDFSNNYYLSVYRISSGELLNRIQTSDNNYFFSPEWISENEVVTVLLTGEGKRLVKFNIDSGSYEVLFGEDLGDIKHLYNAGNYLYFISSYTGKNLLYSLDLKTNQIKQIYESRFGAESPAVSPDGKIILSDYTSDGFKLISIQKESEQELHNLKKEDYPLARKIASQELGMPDFTSNDTTTYESEKYSKASHLFNFHSWAPIFVDVGSYDIQPGVSIMSQNNLGTAETVLGYRWDISEETGQFYANYKYKGWYPVFEFEMSSGKRASKYRLITETKRNEIVNRDTTIERFTWNETSLTADLKIPLNLTRGPYYRLFQPQLIYDFTFSKHDNSTPEEFYEGNYQSMSYRLYYHQLLRQSYQDVWPNFGLIIDGIYRHSPSGSTQLGSLTSGQGVLYLPGVMANHGLKIYGGAQQKENGGYFGFSDVVRFPRGWGRIETNKLYSIAFDYKMPLLNPDVSLGGLAYIKRINASLFTDYANLVGNMYENGNVVGTYNTNISSYGLELTGVMHF
ncbi:MAG: hypothetical protein R3182_11620, partial [Draconibacterium sp.]|nr:hypothetical protein [Draconibacterium sp.]